MRLISVLFAFGVLVLPAALSAQDRYGTTVETLSIEGAPPSMLDENFPIVPGSTLSREAVRRAIQALYDLGGYSRIEVEAVERPGGGTGLVFHVDEPYFFSTVRIEPRGLLERSLSSYISLPHGERFSRSRLDAIVDAVRELTEAEGYFGAGISATYTPDPGVRLVTSVIRVDAGPPARIGEVRFEGAEQIFETGELADAFDVRSGTRFSAERIREGEDRLRALFVGLEPRAGFPETNVEVRQAWDSATNTVDLSVGIEPGRRASIGIRGFALSDDRLHELVPVFELGRFDEDIVEEGRLNIVDYLQREGYLDARVTAVSGATEVVYDVVPGQEYFVEALVITGNAYFEDEAIRREIGLAGPRVFRRGVFSEGLAAEARVTIGAMYAAAGFAETEVGVSTSVERNLITVTIEIREGEQLRIGRIEVTGNTALTRDEVILAGAVFEAEFFLPSELEEARRAIIARYHGLGYANARVGSRVTRGADGVVVAYEIEEGARYDIGRIVVAGQSRTRPSVICRHAGLGGAQVYDAGTRACRPEGGAFTAPYDPEAVLDAQRRLYAAGLFDRVDVVTLDQDREGRRDLLVHVEDASPLLLTYGAGVRQGVDLQDPGNSGSDVDLRGTVEISHNNLWGLDRSLSARIQGGRREQRFQTTYREPQLFNWDLDGFASVFVERARRQQFDAVRIDFSLQTLYEFPNEDNLLLTASFQTIDLGTIRLPIPTDETGTIQVARIGGSWVRDTRNDPFNPSRGNYFSASFQVGHGAYGSEFDFTSLFTQVSLFRPAKSTVVAGSARFGWNQPFGRTGALPITERYFAGGSTTLRAFDIAEAGPSGGGNALFLLNLEYRYPIPFLTSGLSGAVFYDTGTVFPRISDFSIGHFTHTAGIGLRYLTPLGPVRIDYGLNLNRQLPPGELGEPSQNFHFTLGHAF